MGARDLSVETATARLSLFILETCLWLCPCLCSPVQSFQTDVPRASATLLSLFPQQAEVSQCYKKEGFLLGGGVCHFVLQRQTGFQHLEEN